MAKAPGKAEEELFMKITTDPRVMEKAKELREILEEVGAEKHEALDFLIGFFSSQYDSVERLITTLEAIKMSYVLGLVGQMAASGDALIRQTTESDLKPI